MHSGPAVSLDSRFNWNVSTSFKNTVPTTIITNQLQEGIPGWCMVLLIAHVNLQGCGPVAVALLAQHAKAGNKQQIHK
jgi:hypothetical protein